MSPKWSRSLAPDGPVRQAQGKPLPTCQRRVNHNWGEVAFLWRGPPALVVGAPRAPPDRPPPATPPPPPRGAKGASQELHPADAPPLPSPPNHPQPPPRPP